MTLENGLKVFVWFLPLMFAFAFLAPAMAQGMQTLGLSAPFGLSTLAFALIVSGAWGLFAQVTGRWI